MTLNQGAIISFLPETVKSISLCSSSIYVELTNPVGNLLTLASTDLLQIITPLGYFGAEHFAEEPGNLRIVERIESFRRLCNKLVGAELVAISGYKNLYDNTYVFDNGFIIRFMTAGDSWDREFGWRVKMVNELGSSSAGYISVEEQNSYLPLALRTSRLNPFDVLQSAGDSVLESMVGAEIVGADCIPQVGALAAYQLVLFFENDSKISISNSWTVSSRDRVWCSQEEASEEYYAGYREMFRSLIGQELLGFTGPRDLIQPSLLLDGGTRVDQLTRCSVEDPVFGSKSWWSISSVVGEFSR